MRFLSSSLLIVLLVVRTTDAAEPETVQHVLQRLVAAARIYDKRQMASASNQLIRMKGEAVPQLVAVLDDVDDNVRWQAIVALGRIGRPEAVSATSRLVDACRDLDADVRGAAAVALGRLEARSSETIVALRLLRNDEQPMVQADAWWALWRLQHERGAVDALVKLLTSKDWLATSHASRHLAAIGHAAVPGLFKTLADSDQAHGRQAAETLRRMGPRAAAAIPSLLQLLRGNNPQSAVAAARVLGAQDKAAVAGLVSCLEAQNRHSRLLAIVALGEIGPAAAPAVPRLSSKLDNAEGRELRLLAEALGRIGCGTTEGVVGLVRLLDHENQDTRGVACQALGRIGVAAGIADRRLERLARQDPVDFVRRAAVRARANIHLRGSVADVAGPRVERP